MKALTKMERVKQKTNQDYWNAKQKSKSAATNHEPQEQQEQRQTETGLGKQGLEGGYGLTRSLTGPSTEPMRVDHVEGLQEGSLMHTGKGEEQLATEGSRVAEITDA